MVDMKSAYIVYSIVVYKLLKFYYLSCNFVSSVVMTPWQSLEFIQTSKQNVFKTLQKKHRDGVPSPNVAIIFGVLASSSSKFYVTITYSLGATGAKKFYVSRSKLQIYIFVHIWPNPLKALHILTTTSREMLYPFYSLEFIKNMTIFYQKQSEYFFLVCLYWPEPFLAQATLERP